MTGTMVSADPADLANPSLKLKDLLREAGSPTVAG